jgi:Mn-dependent DtxR family transcriptional regulator
MSQPDVHDILISFGPIPSKGIAEALGISKTSALDALKRLKKRGAVKYTKVSGQSGRYGLWDVV